MQDCKYSACVHTKLKFSACLTVPSLISDLIQSEYFSRENTQKNHIITDLPERKLYQVFNTYTNT